MNRTHRTLLTLAASAIALLTGCKSNNTDADKAAINASVQHLAESVEARDLNGIMSYYVPDDSLFVYDVVTPRQYVGAAAYRKDWEETLAPYVGPIHASVADWTVESDGTFAYAHGIFTLAGNDIDGKPLNLTARVTDIYKKVDGKWLVAHEHVSFPMDPASGKADTDSKP